MMLQNLCFVGVLVLCVLLRPGSVHGYIPAQPSNSTIQGSNGTNASRLHLQWYTNGSDWEFVSYQLVGADSNGITQGALVHFSEDYAGNETTTTPWIALVSCDGNSTNMSEEDDIFTMARDRGAQSALLYSLYSETCAINMEYSDPADFDQVFDVFATQTKQTSRLIEYEFGQFGPANQTYYGYYNATMLNETSLVVNQTISSNNPVAPGLLYATLQAYNATGTSSSSNGPANNDSGASTTSSGGSKETGLAMIILYAITGCVSALFCVVIVSGAIRAIRHPERYGPRLANRAAGGSESAAQSRARGLGRAILDTFPVVKFGSAEDDQEPPLARPKDIEAPPAENVVGPVALPTSAVEMGDMTSRSTEEHREHPQEFNDASLKDPELHNEGEDEGPVAGTSQLDPSPIPRPRIAISNDVASQPPSAREGDTLMPESIGRETCPICIVDFEEGDDLRVLPCEGKHRFHQACVDPWLLELSGSCPICRQDFHALETIISGDVVDDPSPLHRHSQARFSTAPQNRFSRYLRFARGRQRSHGGHDPTDPYSPASSDSPQ
ncbi:hypothetical protein HYDPIDRAFT_107293 [Hydnomerulius pinastri MD-312]|nr:hypothetical protein HYDPIDRAFT_107293 [Hydnomerulius pinastri MD-312]